MPKRRKPDESHEDEDSTPRKSRRRQSQGHDPLDSVHSSLSQAQTPSHRKSILKATPSKENGLKSISATPSSLRKVLFSTPADRKEKPGNQDEEETPRAVRNDRSARRKSQRILQEQAADIDDSDDEQAARDEAIAEVILGEDEDQQGEDGWAEMAIDSTGNPETPSKGPKPRGRPKGRRRERTPTPPPDFPPHELYFFQNRTGANKTSANTLPQGILLNHEDYFAQIKDYKDSHAEDIRYLKGLHKRAFDQWMFELEENFNLCLYGYGSKRNLLMDFAEHLYLQYDQPPKVAIINGYAAALTVRDIFATVSSVILPKSAKLPAQPAALLDMLLGSLTKTPPKGSIVLILHSMDHQNLRKAATQGMLARLAAHPSISLVASCDTPNFPILWDVSLTSLFNFAFHDATTFDSYTAEMEVVEDVNALLSRSSRRLGGKDGVGYVLKSLPENARSLFRILVAEQLALADMEGDIFNAIGGGDDSEPEDILGVEDEDEAAQQQQQTSSRRGRGRPKTVKKMIKPVPPQAAVGVEYRTLYHKAVEEFVCSSEVNFRTLLKEFHDHQMIESRKDAMGTERLIVPFRKEELETILEELV